MKSLFNLDNPVMQFLSRVADIMLLNMLTLVCSLPIITAGAALSALHKVCQDIVFETEGGVLVPFFQAFRGNFKQATLAWIGELLAAAVMICDAFLVATYFRGNFVMYVLLVLPAVLGLGVCCYLIPLIARYSNTLRSHLVNAIILTVARLPRTLILEVLSALPVLLFLYAPAFFARTSVFWMAVGFAAVALVQEYVLRGVFRQLEKRNQPAAEA